MDTHVDHVVTVAETQAANGAIKAALEGTPQPVPWHELVWQGQRKIPRVVPPSESGSGQAEANFAYLASQAELGRRRVPPALIHPRGKQPADGWGHHLMCSMRWIALATSHRHRNRTPGSAPPSILSRHRVLQ